MPAALDRIDEVFSGFSWVDTSFFEPRMARMARIFLRGLPREASPFYVGFFNMEWRVASSTRLCGYATLLLRRVDVRLCAPVSDWLSGVVLVWLLVF